MKKGLLIACILIGAGIVIVLAQTKSKRFAKHWRSRWHSVLINRLYSDLATRPLPDPLDQLRSDIETKLQPGPSGQGTRLSARLRQPHASEATQKIRQLRRALHQAQAVLEADNEANNHLSSGTGKPLRGFPLEIATGLEHDTKPYH